MQVTISQYAQALYEVLEKKSQDEVNNAISNFIKILAKNNQLHFKEAIIKKIEEIYNQKNGIVEAEIVEARKQKDAQIYEKIKNYIREKYKAKKVILNDKIDKSLKGGIIIKTKSEIIDGSIQHQLEKLENVLENK